MLDQPFKATSRQLLTAMIRHLRREGTQLAWALDYSVHGLSNKRYLLYYPDPISPLEVAPLPASFGENHHQAALAFLATQSMGATRPVYQPAC